MNKHSPLTLILKYPYIYNNQTWNIDLETSSSLPEYREFYTGILYEN
jgi:hypothetical protein